MIKIPKEMLEQYHTGDAEFYDGNEEEVYHTFLMQTDYICNKIVEGISTKEDYAEELMYRQIAREELSNIEVGE